MQDHHNYITLLLLSNRRQHTAECSKQVPAWPSLLRRTTEQLHEQQQHPQLRREELQALPYACSQWRSQVKQHDIVIY
jgi:hypothetical protein